MTREKNLISALVILVFGLFLVSYIVYAKETDVSIRDYERECLNLDEEKETDVSIRDYERECLDLDEAKENGLLFNNYSNIYNSALLLDKEYNKKKDNIMFSPMSLNMALTLLEEGSDGFTKDVLDNYLGKHTYNDLLTEYNSEELYKINVANSIWADKSITLDKNYVTKMEYKYKAKVDTLDFNKDTEKSVLNINKWCKKQTNGMIPKIVDADKLKDMKTVLINTLYFKANWLDSFIYDETNKKTFTKIDGTKDKVAYMYGEASSVYENKYATAFSKDYIGGIEFIGILPKIKGEFNLVDLDIDELLHSETKDYDKIEVRMPKLNFETELDLYDSLNELELDNIFSNKANFSKINKDLYVSSVIQKTKIKLDENGTEASSATMVGMVDGVSIDDAKKKRIKKIYLNRPYVFCIYDRENDEILFLGKVVNCK